jgi:hypothetical protein
MVAARLGKEPSMALSDTQLVVLSAACQRSDRSVYPLPAGLPGGAAAKVLGALLKQELIKEVQAKREDTVWREDKKRGQLTLRATPAAFKALGIDPTEAAAGEAEKERDTAEAEGINARLVPDPSREPQPVAETDRGQRPRRRAEIEGKTRTDTKQARLIAMLERPEGATIEEIATALAWQPHTVRGAIAGALKKKLGLSVASENDDVRGRVYRIIE